MSDLISRQAAIDALSCENPTETYIYYDDAVKAIRRLTSAQPEPEPVGCSGCRYERFGGRVCDVCSRFYADRYERRTDG